MRRNKNDGNNVNRVSSSAKIISRKKFPYEAAKAALARLTQYAASEIAEYKINIISISPAYVFTPCNQIPTNNIFFISLLHYF